MMRHTLVQNKNICVEKKIVKLKYSRIIQFHEFFSSLFFYEFLKLNYNCCISIHQFFLLFPLLQKKIREIQFHEIFMKISFNKFSSCILCCSCSASKFGKTEKRFLKKKTKTHAPQKDIENSQCQQFQGTSVL